MGRANHADQHAENRDMNETFQILAVVNRPHAGTRPSKNAKAGEVSIGTATGAGCK